MLESYQHYDAYALNEKFWNNPHKRTDILIFFIYSVKCEFDKGRIENFYNVNET